ELILYDRATLVARPVGEGQIIDADIVEAGAHRRRRRQCRPPAALAVRDDVIAWTKARTLQHGPQHRRWSDDPVLHQLGVRQMPRARQMPATWPAACVLAGISAQRA